MYDRKGFIIFKWCLQLELNCFKKYKVYEEFTTGKTSKLIEKLIKLHEDNCNEILSMLKENNNEW